MLSLRQPSLLRAVNILPAALLILAPPALILHVFAPYAAVMTPLILRCCRCFRFAIYMLMLILFDSAMMPSMIFSLRYMLEAITLLRFHAIFSVMIRALRHA